MDTLGYLKLIQPPNEELMPHELGRILLHFTARRGYLSTKKQAGGDLNNDPDMMFLLIFHFLNAGDCIQSYSALPAKGVRGSE